MKTTKTIKTLSILLFFALAIVATSCKKDKDGTTGKTGTFSIDGVSYSGETEDQTFVNDNYSIVCQQDDPFKFVQITFHNQAEAEAGGTFDVEDYSLNVSSGSVQVGTSDIITSDPEGSYTISVSGKKITINNVDIKSTGGSGATATINSASINF
jgi:hypothetical protein